MPGQKQPIHSGLEDILVTLIGKHALRQGVTVTGYKLCLQEKVVEKGSHKHNWEHSYLCSISHLTSRVLMQMRVYQAQINVMQ